MAHNQHFRVHLRTNVQKTCVRISARLGEEPPGDTGPAWEGDGTGGPEMQPENTKSSGLHLSKITPSLITVRDNKANVLC